MGKAKFHYAIWFEAGSKQVRSWSQTSSKLVRTCLRPASNQLRTCLRPALSRFVLFRHVEIARTCSGRSWSQTSSKRNSITLSVSKLVRSWSQTGSKLVADLSQTC